MIGVFEIVAGFAPKDLMFLMYIPIYLVIIVISIAMMFYQKKGIPHASLALIFPLVPVISYLYDKFIRKGIVKSQEILLFDMVAVSVVYTVANSSIIPNTSEAVDLMFGVAVLVGLIFAIASIVYRKRDT